MKINKTFRINPLMLGLWLAAIVFVWFHDSPSVHAQGTGIPFILHLSTGPSSSCPAVVLGDSWICSTTDKGFLVSNGGPAFTIAPPSQPAPTNFTQLDCATQSVDAAGIHSKTCSEK